MAKTVITILIFFLSVVYANKNWPIGEARPTTYKDLKDHPSSSKTYNEFWTYHFIFEKNMQVTLNYSRANLGSFQKPITGANVSMINFKGKNYSVARQYPKRKFKFTDITQKLNVHEKIWFEGKLPEIHRVHFVTTKKKITYTIDLIFTNIQPGVSWGDGIFKIGKEKLGIYIHIPRANVSGIIAINKDTLKVTGLAYMDHIFQTTSGTDLTNAGYRYYSTGAKVNMGYMVKPLGKYKIPWIGYGLIETDGKMEIVKPTSIIINSREKKSKINVPKKFTIKHVGNNIVVQRSKDHQVMSILDGVDGWFAKKALKIFMGGEIIYFRGVGQVNGEPAVMDFFGFR